MPERVRALARQLYGDAGDAAADDLVALARRYGPVAAAAAGSPWSERDAWLIAYPDQFAPAEPSQAPLARLAEVFDRHLAGTLNGIHLLPCFPWSCDDGYGVVDHTAIDPRYGTWDDVARLAASDRLMLDAVVNHTSSQSPWFRGFLAGDPEYAGFYVVPPAGADLSTTVRPRTTPLTHAFESARGRVAVWTTFSEDQVDLDLSNPRVLVRIAGVLLEYARRGAAAIRLDAVAYVWKQPGTGSINLPQAHLVVRLLRAVVDLVRPDVLLVAETNVPHADNVAYLGAGEREAQAVYQFALAPLVLHAITTGSTAALTGWAAALDPPPPGTTFLNVLASHDGIGLRPVEGILAEREIAALAAAVRAAGGRVSSRSTPDGDRPYELNTTWFSAMGFGAMGRGELAVRRHLAAHATMLALRGIAGVYVHSLVGSRNAAGAATARGLNRARFAGDPFAAPSPVLDGMRALLAARAGSDAFHPDADQHVVDAPDGVFAVERCGRTTTVRVTVDFRPPYTISFVSR